MDWDSRRAGLTAGWGGAGAVSAASPATGVGAMEVEGLVGECGVADLRLLSMPAALVVVRDGVGAWRGGDVRV